MCLSKPYHNTGASDSGSADVGPTQQEDAIAKNSALSTIPFGEVQQNGKMDLLLKYKLLSFYKLLVEPISCNQCIPVSEDILYQS